MSDMASSNGKPESSVPDEGMRLYGTHGAEVLYSDPASAYESGIEPWADEHDRRPRLIEEWSVHAPIDHVPAADWIAESVIEMCSDELIEVVADEWWELRRDPEVLAAIEPLRTLLASKVRGRMANKLLRSLTITWDEDGQPLLDGEPMYVRRDA